MMCSPVLLCTALVFSVSTALAQASGTCSSASFAVPHCTNELSSSVLWATATHPEAAVLPTSTRLSAVPTSAECAPAADVRAIHAYDDERATGCTTEHAGDAALLRTPTTTAAVSTLHDEDDDELTDPLGCGIPPRWYVGLTGAAPLALPASAEEPSAFAAFAASHMDAVTLVGWSAGLQVKLLLGSQSAVRDGIPPQFPHEV